MRPHGRARASVPPRSAWAVCDRCGCLYNHADLSWQYQWAGPALQNLRLLVCRQCLDVPQDQLRTIIIGPDPIPIQNPRPQDYAYATQDFIGVTTWGTDPETGIPVPLDTTIIADQNGNPISSQQTGAPFGSVTDTPGFDPNAPGADDPGLPYGFTEFPKSG